MIRAVLFDLDGTLADTAPDLGYALNRLRERRGLPALPAETIRPMASHGARGLLGVGFGIGPEDPRFDALRDEFLEAYAENVCRETRLFPGMAELLDEMERRNLPWGIVTNKAARFTLPLLRGLRLFHRAACVVSGDDCPRLKPHPDSLLKAAENLGVAPETIVYVGDDERDVQAGLAAGMRVLVANWGYLGEASRPQEWPAHGRIDTPIELLRHLEV